MDVWAVGRAPAGVFSYAFPKEFVKKTKAEHDGAQVSRVRPNSLKSRMLTRGLVAGLLPSYARDSRAGETE